MKKRTAVFLLVVCAVLAAVGAAGAEGAKFVTIREWLEAKGECGDCMLVLKIQEELNPVVALAADETGTVHLFSGANEESSYVAFMSEQEGPKTGAVLVVANPIYNEYEGNVEMAQWTLLRLMPAFGGETGEQPGEEKPEEKPAEEQPADGQEAGAQPADGRFAYEHDPRENPAAMADIVENPDAVYGFSPNPESQRLGNFASYDWTDPAFVAGAKEERKAYHESMDTMTDIILQMRDQGATLEEIARAVSTERNRLRMEASKDNPDSLAATKESNLKTYGHEDGPTPDQLYEKYGSWEAVLQKAFSTNMGMDACCGLYDEYYWLYVELGYVK